VTSATCAAEELASALYPVPDDSAAAMFTHRCQLVNGTLKAVEHMPVSCRDDLEAERVFITADFAFRHACEIRLSTLLCSVTATFAATPVEATPYRDLYPPIRTRFNVYRDNMRESSITRPNYGRETSAGWWAAPDPEELQRIASGGGYARRSEPRSQRRSLTPLDASANRGPCAPRICGADCANLWIQV
jgi:hypothetical protein